ncbi:hypothetical protein SERLA73DRAFT_181922, partial [Serpula lacrymans var. lacrymans S7.3]
EHVCHIKWLHLSSSHESPYHSSSTTSYQYHARIYTDIRLRCCLTLCLCNSWQETPVPPVSREHESKHVSNRGRADLSLFVPQCLDAGPEGKNCSGDGHPPEHPASGSNVT